MGATVAYGQYFNELDSLVSDMQGLVQQVNTSDRGSMIGYLDTIAEIKGRVHQDADLRVALIGEFSAGKSSLIAALTGASVRIDADVCTTDTTEYSWQGITLVDTPGIQAESGATNHDDIARNATVGADLVLFVVTNELFNPRLANHLRFILDDTGLGLAAKTALLVNKMDRENNPDDALQSDIIKVLEHHTIPIYFCAASRYLEAQHEKDPSLATRFERKSRMAVLIEGINRFVDDAGVHGRLTTPLQRLTDLADQVEQHLMASEFRSDELMLLKRRKTVIQELQQELYDLRRNSKHEAYSLVMRQTAPQVEQIEAISSEADIDELYGAGMQAAAVELDRLCDRLEKDIIQALSHAEQQLEALGASLLEADAGHVRVRHKSSGNAPKVCNKPSNAIWSRILKGFQGNSVKQGLEKLADNTKGLRDVIYSIGKKMGKKFGPWEAVNLGKSAGQWIGRLSKAMPFVASALNIFCQYREEKAQAEKARYQAQLRNTLRNSFSSQAESAASALEQAVIAVLDGPVSLALQTIDSAAHAITAQSRLDKTVVAELARIRARCTELRRHLTGAGHAAQHG